MNRLFLAIAMMFMLSAGILAQGVSGVTGVVADPTGAVIPGANVVLLDTKTSREFTATANDNGVYVFNNVPPGTGYRLTFTAPGDFDYVCLPHAPMDMVGTVAVTPR